MDSILGLTSHKPLRMNDYEHRTVQICLRTSNFISESHIFQNQKMLQAQSPHLKKRAVSSEKSAKIKNGFE